MDMSTNPNINPDMIARTSSTSHIPSHIYNVTLAVLLALASLLATAMPARAQQFRQLSMSDGLSQLSVLCIYQDRLGRMWFGTEEGLNVYDGNNVVAIKSFGGIAATGLEVYALSGDDDGNIYFVLGNSIVKLDYRTQAYSYIMADKALTLFCKDGWLWYGRGSSLYRRNTRTGATQHMGDIAAGSIFAIQTDRRGNVWIGTRSGLCLMRRGTRTVRHVVGKSITDYLYCDSKGNIWASTRDDGCYRISPSGHADHFTATPQAQQPTGGTPPSADDMRTQRSLSSNITRQICEDSKGNVWIGTFLGLNVYDPKTGTFGIHTTSNRHGSISHNSVYAIVRDNHGTMWLGTYYGGVNYANPSDDIFRFYNTEAPSDRRLSYPFVGHMQFDRRGDLWICTEGGGLNRIDHATGHIDHFLMDGTANSLPQNNLKCIAYDPKRDRLYIGTHLGGLSVLDIPTRRFTNLMAASTAATKYGDRIVDMKMWGDKLIFTSQTGVWTLDPNTLHITPTLRHNVSVSENYIHIDRRGTLWICDESAVYKVTLPNGRVTATYRCGTNGLGRHQLRRIAEDDKGRIYVTSGGGIYRLNPKTGTFDDFCTQNSNILSDFCYDMTPANGGILVYNTDRGIGFFNSRTDQFRNVEFSKDFPLTGIHKWCGLLANGDNICVGGTNGMVAFSMAALMTHKTSDRLYMSRIVVNNHDCTPSDGTGILESAAYLTDRLHLNHDQNNITFWFATNHNADNISQPIYEYRLKGYDDTWQTTSERSITYPKLPAGNYTLEIREKAEPWQDTANAETLRMKVTVAPPFYRSPLAYLLYTAMLIGMAWAFYRFKRSQLLLETSLAMEKKDKQNIEALNKAKLQFFTSISHEFRTPLTLIIAKLDYMMQNVAKNSSTAANLKSVNQNANQMLELVNELLDFRKMEQGHTRLAIARHDMVEFAHGIATAFNELARLHAIDYTFHASAEKIECWFDQKQMQKVIYNLISNAFKYTSRENGIIEVRVDQTDADVTLRVIDNGMGIAKQDLKRIFERFYQSGGESIDNTANTRGTGIGLALVKQITERHHGTIEALSSEGCGSIFVLTLKKGHEQFDDDELCDVCATTATPQRPADVRTPPGDTHARRAAGDHATPDDTHGEATDTPRPTLLAVEDNDELLDTLAQIFAPLYRVLKAHDGSEGLDMARRESPDIIVSDIMMPVMDGIEMCKAIKNDVAVSHIPILLLTAMSATEQEVEGLRCGADDYVAKPFNPTVLTARVGALLRMRTMLQKKFAQEDMRVIDAKNFSTNKLDRQFVEDCDRIINEHLLDSEYSVDDMARELAMSRTTFFAKFKALTGQTPGDYIITQRLGKAADRLRQDPTLSISDVAYGLGFSSPRYFSQCFKKRYGKNPTEWREA